MDANELPVDPISLIGPEAITERQREVARLVAGGLTNGQIAQELGITLDGAKFHVSGLLTRLGLRQREEVAEWYRAHFGRAARVRAQARRLLALPTLGWIGAASTAGGVIAVAVVMLVVRGGAIAPEVAAPRYDPFVQEWEISRADQETEYATLDWNSCEEWTYEVHDTAGTILASTRGEVRADGSCGIPGFWFLPIDSYRGNPDPRDTELTPYSYERTLQRPCAETEGSTPTSVLPPDFCAAPDDTFEDRVLVEFDPATEIPMSYTQYVDGIVMEAHRATSLSIK